AKQTSSSHSSTPVEPVSGAGSILLVLPPATKAMRTRILAGSLAISIVAFMMVTASRMGAQAPAGLTGVVSSQEEGLMEGVVVSAKRSGSTMTVSVMTDARGRYAFPAGRFEPG